jgi:NADH:ubiquinone oxidoreductase subunit 6 (subunit J)
LIEPKGSVAVEREERATDQQARKTALVVAAVLLLIAAWNFYRGRMSVVFIFGAVGVLLLFAGLLFPAAARVFHNAWMRFASVLGYVNSRVLLSVMFYGALTPYGFVSRLAGRDPLKRRAKKQGSYWIPRERTRQAREGFERLF